MTLPKIKRSHSLRALLVTGVVFTIGGVSLAGAAHSNVERAPRSVALVKAHQSTARPRPEHVAVGLRGGPAGQDCRARPDRLVPRAPRDHKA